jgi:hypothetical protein
VAWLRGDELTPAESGVDGGLHHQAVLGREGGKDGVVLGGRQCGGLLLDDRGELGVGAGVEGDDPVALGAFEDRVQHGVVLPQDGGRQAVPVSGSRAVVTQRWISVGRILPIGRFPKVGMKCLSR